MPVLPSDVRDTTFRIVRRGYATQEVDAFLDMVQEELARLTAARGAEPTDAGSVATPADGAPAGAPEVAAPAGAPAGAPEVVAPAGAPTAAPEVAAPAGGPAAAAPDGPAPGGADLALSVLRMAEQTAEQLVRAAREQAAALADEACAQRRSEAAALERRCAGLQAEVDDLVAQREEHRAALIALLEQQLRRARAEEWAPLAPVSAA